MDKLENKCEVLNILINSRLDHPALHKFVACGGIPPLFEMCCRIRENHGLHQD